MKVTLLAYTPNPADIAEIGAKTCYSATPPTEIVPTESKNALKRALASGHHSVLEHAVFTFSIEGVSRALSHQLVRHRMASYSQQSQRYVEIENPRDNFIMPKTISEQCQVDEQNGLGWDDGGCLTDWINNYFVDLKKIIERAREAGIPEEDIRYFYPNGTTTNIVVTMNARELLHFFSLRCCSRAQWEIREVANSMLSICKEVCPEIFADAGAYCEQNKYCKETNSCGKYMTLKEILTTKKE